MNLLIKKRQLILAILVIALGAAVFVNWYYSGENSNVKNPVETTDGEYVQNLGEAKYVNASGEAVNYFDEVKLNRQKTRDEALDKLNKSLKSAKSGSKEAGEITASIDKLSTTIKLESDIEALIGAKLSSECVVVLNEGSAQVVVAKGALSDDSALQIMDIITSNTSLDSSQIAITESK